MDPIIAPSAQLLHISDQLFHKGLTDLDRESLLKRCGSESNPIIWIAGHLTLSRCGLARLIGLEVDHPWADLFARSAKVTDDLAYPEIGEIISVWDDVSPQLISRLENMTGEQLSSRAGRDFPIADKSLRGAIAFMAWHESYHLGQIAFIRKWLGLGSFVG